MSDDADKGGEWVTGIIGAPFQVDKDGNPIPVSPSEPTEPPSSDDVLKGLEDAMGHLGTGGTGDLMPTGIVPGGSQEIGGNDDETQKEIWAELDRGEFGSGAGSGAGSIPADAERLM